MHNWCDVLQYIDAAAGYFVFEVTADASMGKYIGVGWMRKAEMKRKNRHLASHRMFCPEAVTFLSMRVCWN